MRLATNLRDFFLLKKVQNVEEKRSLDERIAQIGDFLRNPLFVRFSHLNFFFNIRVTLAFPCVRCPLQGSPSTKRNPR